MKFTELTILLPCHSLEDFPLYHEGEEAEGLLAAWSVLWHPALIRAAGKLPVWSRADTPPEDLAGRLIAVPAVSQAQLPAEFTAQCEAAGARLLPPLTRREELVQTALAMLGEDAGASDLAGDFLALGTAWLQVELLTRRMRYTSSMDDAAFQNMALTAAEAALRGDEAIARENLARCFEKLTDARRHFYPVENYLLDWTLIAPTTIGASLRAELARPTPLNLFVTGATVAQIARDEPDTLAGLRARVAAGTVSLVGGEFEELDLPLLPLEAIRRNLERGLAECQRHLGARPVVFARRRFGLTPALPQVLRKWGFQAAIHATLDDGRFPVADRSKLLWEGIDGTAIDALGRVPLDAADPAGCWKLPQSLGTTMDMDHVATVSLAHWPGITSAWYEDLRRMSAYGPVLGEFITLNKYFDDTEAPMMRTRFRADDYRSPYLSQAVSNRQGDPLSRNVEDERHRATADAAHTLSTLTNVIRGRCEAGEAIDLAGAAQNLAAALPRDASSSAAGYLVFNPLSATRQIEVEAAELTSPPAIDGPLVGADETGGHRRILVEVPPLGFAWVGDESGEKSKPARKTRGPVAQGNRLANEWFEVVIHPAMGGIQAIHDLGRRGNRLSQHIALRMPGQREAEESAAGAEQHWHDSDDRAVYSAMIADKIEVTISGAHLGEIVSRGRLVDPAGRRVADFRQSVRLWRQSRVIQLEIELDRLVELSADPWNSYYAARFAWADEAAEVRRSVHQAALLTEAARIEAPQFLEIQSDDRRTSILTGGLPVHRRIGMRKLDSLLVVRGESARNFRLAIGIDVSNVAAAAAGLITPAAVVSPIAPPGPVRSGWLFHLSGRNVIATDWEPLVADGRVTGIRLRVLETKGQPGATTLRTFRPAASARLLDFENHAQGDLHVEGDQVKLDIAAFEWLQVEVRF